MYLTVAGLMAWDDTVFDRLVLPSGADIQTAIDTICFSCAELPLLYSQPDVFRWAIGVWSQSRAYAWRTLWATTQLEYDPIENYNRYEEISDSTDTSSNASGTSSSTGQRSNKVRAFDGGALVDKDQSSDTGSTSTSSTGSGKEKYTRTGHMHGNIGVTTSQQMLMSEREVAEFSFYDKISAEFKARFCVMTY